jgi:hypothetical protein
MAKLMAGFEEGEDWVFNLQLQKKQLPPDAHAAIAHWLTRGQARAPLPGTGFDHVITYMARGEKDILLEHSLGGIGYTRAELDELKTTGKTALDVAREIVARVPDV